MNSVSCSPRRPFLVQKNPNGGGNSTQRFCTSLDINYTKLAVQTSIEQQAQKRGTWGKKQKRAYQRCLSGIRKAEMLGKRIRFMTLTTSQQANEKELNKDFTKLKKRIKRRYGKFEYFMVRTNEGNGVLHIIYRGEYIDQKWLSRTWSEIHDSKIVDVRMLKDEKKRLAKYLVSQYVVDQTFTRMSWSWGWVFRGFVGVWKSVVKRYREEGLRKILREWDKILWENTFRQIGLDWKYVDWRTMFGFRYVI